jgi:O-antigen ligase
MFVEAPLTGIGFGRFAGRFFELAPDLPPPHPGVMTTHAHQLPLHVAAEFGIPGLVVLVAGLLFWWRGARRPTDPVSAWACAVALVAGVQSLFEYPLWFAYLLGPVAFALGAAEGPRLEFAGRRVGDAGIRRGCRDRCRAAVLPLA